MCVCVCVSCEGVEKCVSCYYLQITKSLAAAEIAKAPLHRAASIQSYSS